MKDRPYIPKAEAARILGVTVISINNLVKSGLLSNQEVGRGVSQVDVNKLLESKRISFESNQRILRHPIGPIDEVLSLRLHPSKDAVEIEEYNEHLRSTGRGHLTYLEGEREFVSGIGISDKDVEALATRESVICHMSIDWIVSVSEIIDHVKNAYYQNQKVFVVRPLSEDQLKNWKGIYLPSNSRRSSVI